MTSSGCLLTLTTQSGSTRVLIAVDASPVFLGRHDAGTLASSEVDLSVFEAQRHGISRRHAAICITESVLALEDLGSRNGTFINGERLAPYVAHVLRDGDILRLGRLNLRLKVVDPVSGEAV
jgi:pSer/pThr/pTyr-binding forkhead associated (FHA) protein